MSDLFGNPEESFFMTQVIYFYCSDHDKIEIGLTMDGGSNFFLGVDKPSADTVVQGAITPSEAANANGRFKTV